MDASGTLASLGAVEQVAQVAAQLLDRDGFKFLGAGLVEDGEAATVACLPPSQRGWGHGKLTRKPRAAASWEVGAQGFKALDAACQVMVFF